MILTTAHASMDTTPAGLSCLGKLTPFLAVVWPAKLLARLSRHAQASDVLELLREFRLLSFVARGLLVGRIGLAFPIRIAVRDLGRPIGLIRLGFRGFKRQQMKEHMRVAQQATECIVQWYIA